MLIGFLILFWGAAALAPLALGYAVARLWEFGLAAPASIVVLSISVQVWLFIAGIREVGPGVGWTAFYASIAGVAFGAGGLISRVWPRSKRAAQVLLGASGLSLGVYLVFAGLVLGMSCAFGQPCPQL